MWGKVPGLSKTLKGRLIRGWDKEIMSLTLVTVSRLIESMTKNGCWAC